MAIISPTLLLTSYSSYHLILAYYLITDPSVVANHAFVSVLESGLSLPSPAFTPSSATSTTPKTSPFSASSTSAFAIPNSAAALAGLLFGFLAISDLGATVGLDWNTIGRQYWANSALIRLLICFAGIPWVWASTKYAGMDDSDGALVANSLVFALGLVELFWLFGIFNGIREEKMNLRKVTDKDT